ncbi:unnamed protein product, partial [Allacma fusca]
QSSCHERRVQESPRRLKRHPERKDNR